MCATVKQGAEKNIMYMAKKVVPTHEQVEDKMTAVFLFDKPSNWTSWLIIS